VISSLQRNMRGLPSSREVPRNPLSSEGRTLIFRVSILLHDQDPSPLHCVYFILITNDISFGIKADVTVECLRFQSFSAATHHLCSHFAERYVAFILGVGILHPPILKVTARCWDSNREALVGIHSIWWS